MKQNPSAAQSRRRAISGSILGARLAGRKAAAIPTIAMNAAIASRTSGSKVLEPSHRQDQQHAEHHPHAGTRANQNGDVTRQVPNDLLASRAQRVTVLRDDAVDANPGENERKHADDG